MNRYVTYDIKDGNSYESLYNYFDEVKAKYSMVNPSDIIAYSQDMFRQL